MKVPTNRTDMLTKIIRSIIFIVYLLKVSSGQFPIPQCPPIGTIALQNPNSCRSFLICINGVQLTQNCAPGLEFDIVAGNCNNATIANCNLCAANPDNKLHFILDEQLCDKYTMCIGADASKRTCQTGLHFNLAINACDLPQNANCPHTTPLPTPLPTPPIQTTESPITDPPTQPTPPTHPGLVEADCDLNRNYERIASVRNCSRYLVCACGHMNIEYCAPGLIYDVVNKRCDLRCNGAICLNDDPIKCPTIGTINLAHPIDARHYYFCLNGLPILRPCPPGTEFNLNIGQCDVKCDEVLDTKDSYLIRMSHKDEENHIKK